MTTNAVTRIEVVHGSGVSPASVAARLALESHKGAAEAVALSNFFGGIAAGNDPAKIRVAVDSHADVAAALTLAVTGANIAAAEYLDIVTPIGSFRITAVASGAASGDGTFNTSGTSSTCATNIKNAINTCGGLKDWVIATTSTADLILTAARPGTTGNSYRAIDGTVNGLSPAGGSFSGGLDASAQATASITCVFANTDADDTVTIGRTVMTAKASGASGEGQFNLGTDNATMTANLLAKLQAHSELLGVATFAAVSNAITITFTVPVRVALHIRLATSDADGLVIVQPSSTLTSSSTQATRTYALGAP